MEKWGEGGCGHKYKKYEEDKDIFIPNKSCWFTVSQPMLFLQTLDFVSTLACKSKSKKRKEKKRNMYTMTGDLWRWIKGINTYHSTANAT